MWHKGEELHLTPFSGTFLQMRPSFAHIDAKDESAKRSAEDAEQQQQQQQQEGGKKKETEKEDGGEDRVQVLLTRHETVSERVVRSG